MEASQRSPGHGHLGGHVMPLGRRISARRKYHQRVSLKRQTKEQGSEETNTSCGYVPSFPQDSSTGPGKSMDRRSKEEVGGPLEPNLAASSTAITKDKCDTEHAHAQVCPQNAFPLAQGEQGSMAVVTPSPILHGDSLESVVSSSGTQDPQRNRQESPNHESSITLPSSTPAPLVTGGSAPSPTLIPPPAPNLHSHSPPPATVSSIRPDSASFHLRTASPERSTSPTPSPEVLRSRRTTGGARRALLIAVRYANAEKERQTCEEAIQGVKDLLHRFHYQPKDIHVLSNMHGDSGPQPTHKTILETISHFVGGIQPGDRLVFFFHGRSQQVRQ